MNFDNIELAAAELRNEPWVTPVSMNADPAVRAYLAAATPTRVHELIQIVKRQKVAHDNLVLEVAAEKQRADMLLEQAQHAATAVQAWQQRYEKLAQELAAAKAAIPAQTGMIGVTVDEMSFVINWLEGGRDPKEAAKELRLYCERDWKAAQSAHHPLPKWIDDQKGSGPDTDALIEYIEQMLAAQPVQQPAPVPDARAYTVEQVRDEFLDQARHLVAYWEREARASTAKEKLEGLAFSIMNIFDGTTGLPAFDIVCAPHPDDKQFHIDEGSQYYESGMVINDCHLHEMLFAAPVAAPVDVPAASVQPDLEHIKQLANALSIQYSPHTITWVGLIWAVKALVKALVRDSGRDAALVAIVKAVRRDGDPAFAHLLDDYDRAAHPANVAQPLKPMGEDGNEWYFDCDGHYIDVKRDAAGKYSVYFRNQKDGSEAYSDKADANVSQVGVLSDEIIEEAIDAMGWDLDPDGILHQARFARLVFAAAKKGPTP